MNWYLTLRRSMESVAARRIDLVMDMVLLIGRYQKYH